MRFQMQTLQLLSGPERSSYTGTVVEILESLDGRLSVRHEGSTIAAHSGIAQKRPRESRKSSFFLSGARSLAEDWRITLQPLDSGAEDKSDHGMITDGGATADKTAGTSARKPTFLQTDKWKAIRRGRRKGMSLRSIERGLGIHRGTIKKYLDAEGPPSRQYRVDPSEPSSDAVAAYRVTYMLKT